MIGVISHLHTLSPIPMRSSLSTHVPPPIEQRAADVSPLRAQRRRPMVHATSCRHAFSGVYVVGDPCRCTTLVRLIPRPPYTSPTMCSRKCNNCFFSLFLHICRGYNGFHRRMSLFTWMFRCSFTRIFRGGGRRR